MTRRERPDEAVSLSPLTPEQALRALLAVSPKAEEGEPRSDEPRNSNGDADSDSEQPR